MAISSITPSKDPRIDLRQLQVLEVVLRERNLTRAAASLGVTQPALSKTLAALREYFSDPLLVRVGNRMEPTSKALEIQPAVREILDRVTTLKAAHGAFDPATSSRVFSFSVVDSGLVRLVPPLLDHLRAHAPRVRLNVHAVDTERLEAGLESGRLDFAMGSYPSLTKRIRRQRLWAVSYVSLVRRQHPRAARPLSAKAFAAERHVLVSAAGTGHAHQALEKDIEAAVPAQNIVCRVPSFVSAAVVASRTDVIATVPTTLGELLAGRLGLRVIEPPMRLPRIEISQYWHERFHREPGSVWIRRVFAELFGAGGARRREASR